MGTDIHTLPEKENAPRILNTNLREISPTKITNL